MKVKKISAIIIITAMTICLCACGKADHFIGGIGLGVSESEAAEAMNYYLAMAAIYQDDSEKYMELYEENDGDRYYGALGKKYPGMVVFHFTDGVSDKMTYTHTGDDLRESYEFAWDYFTEEYGEAVSGSKDGDSASWSKDGIHVNSSLTEESLVITVDDIEP